MIELTEKKFEITSNYVDSHLRQNPCFGGAWPIFTSVKLDGEEMAAGRGEDFSATETTINFQGTFGHSNECMLARKLKIAGVQFLYNGEPGNNLVY